MDWKIPVCLITGGVVGFLLSPKISKSSSEIDREAAKEEVVTVEAGSKNASLASLKVFKNVTGSLSFPSWAGSREGSSEEWLSILTKFSENGQRPWDEKRLEAEMLASLVKPDQFAHILEMLHDEELGLEGMGMLEKALYSKWLDSDSGGLEEWLKVLPDDVRAARLSQLINSAPERHSEKAIDFYEGYLAGDSSQDMGNVTSRLMQLYAKNRSIEEFWEFNDSLPSTVSNRYLSSAVNAISDENFGQFLGGIFDRKGKAGYSEYNVQQLLERWGKKDPQAAIDWLDQSSYDDRYSHRVYASILQAGNLDEFPELTQRFVEDDRLSNKILQGVLQTVYSKQGVERFKKVFQSLPEGSSYGLEDIKQRVGTLYYNSPLLIPDLVSAVPNKDDQLELLESGFSKIANEHRRYQFNEADFSLLEKRLEETLLTIEEREDLMNKARKHFEKK